MKNNDTMAGLEMDFCPVHEAEVKKEYTFGMQDANVVVWECKCAACYIGDALNDDGTYHTSYADAAGRARLGKAIAALPLR